MTPSSEFQLLYGPTMVAPPLLDNAVAPARVILEKLLSTGPRGYEKHAFVFPESRRFLVTLHEDLLRRLEIGRREEVKSVVEELLEDRACLKSYIEPLMRTFDDYTADLRALLRALKS